jgi:hypothetical protein
MLRTVILGSCISVQGVFERFLPNGLMAVRDGSKVYVGKPI